MFSLTLVGLLPGGNAFNNCCT